MTTTTTTTTTSKSDDSNVVIDMNCGVDSSSMCSKVICNHETVHREN